MNKIILIGLLFSFDAQALTTDEKLKLVIEINNIKASTCSISSDRENAELSKIGESIFNLKQLSGTQDTSCASCHLEDKHLADGLPVAIGVGGGDAEGLERQKTGAPVVARNAFTLFGRSNEDYQNFFWDGRVSKVNNKIFSPIGSKGFDSALEVALVLPLLARDEFLGQHSMFSSSEAVDEIDDQYYEDRALAFNKTILGNIESHSNDVEVQEFYSLLYKKGYTKKDVNISFIGKALAAFVADNSLMKCKPSAWDIYLSGDDKALTSAQKSGALIFFGKGRCASCHSGSLFSDFKFHSLGIPQGEYGTYMHRQDLGRAEVTFDEKDRYKFRTPSLLGVSKTEPYGHNGVFDSLQDTVIFHLNPIEFFSKNGWTSKKEFLGYGRLLSSRSSRLGYIDIDNEEELKDLLSFLGSL